MSWKDNRRRKRTWYKHYKFLADSIMELTRTNQSIAGEELVRLLYRTYERYRLHGKRRVALSARESLELACRDAGLTQVVLVPLINRLVRDEPRPVPSPERVRTEEDGVRTVSLDLAAGADRVVIYKDGSAII